MEAKKPACRPYGAHSAARLTSMEQRLLLENWDLRRSGGLIVAAPEKARELCEIQDELRYRARQFAERHFRPPTTGQARRAEEVRA